MDAWPALISMTCRCKEGNTASPVPVLGHSIMAPSVPAPQFPGGSEVGGVGEACLAADAHHTAGKCQCLPGHLSPSAWLPAAFCSLQKGPAVSRGKGAEPG